MVFPYKVKHNGIYYLPGENVPLEDSTVKAEPKIEPIAEPEVTEEVKEKRKYTRKAK